MTDKTEKQASPGPFDDKNLGDAFSDCISQCTFSVKERF